MRKLIYVVVLWFSTLMLKAIESEPVQSKASGKLHLGISLVPSIAFRTIRIVEDNSYGRRNYNDRQKNETFSYGHNIGLDIVYMFNGTFALQTGLNYSMK